MSLGHVLHNTSGFFFLRFSRAVVLIDKIYQTLRTMFDHISKHLEVRQNTPPRVVFSSLFLVFGNVVKHGLSCLIYI